MNYDKKIILVTIGFGLVVWLLVSVLEHLLFSNGAVLGTQGAAISWATILIDLVLLASFLILGLRIARMSPGPDRPREEIREESDERFRLALEATNDGLWDFNLKTNKTYFNPQYYTMLGYEPYELPQSYETWRSLIHPEDRERVINHIDKCTENDMIYQVEFRFKTKDGGWRWILGRGRVVERDENGKPLRRVGTHTDITIRKNMEQELITAKKLESIGRLAGGIAHDFNNLLSMIMGNISLAEEDLDTRLGISEFLDDAKEACLRAKELTGQLVTFAEGGAPKKKIGAIGDLVEQSAGFALSGSNVGCDISISDDPRPVEFDMTQMKRALSNLIINAAESMPEGGSIRVTVKNADIGPDAIERGLNLAEGKYVKISIRDEGVGIPEDHLSRVFDPYFSTKEMGSQKGMGMGLATTYSIIYKHHGYITVDSEPGMGATFSIYLPAREKKIAAAAPVKAPKSVEKTAEGGRILLMDDEMMIRNLAAQMFTRLGYESEAARDGAEAIRMYTAAMEAGNAYDLVVLDLTIKGGMGGKETIKLILELNPLAKIIVSSGYSSDPVMTSYKEYGFKGVLPKPYTLKGMEQALRKAMEVNVNSCTCKE